MFSQKVYVVKQKDAYRAARKVLEKFKTEFSAWQDKKILKKS